MTVTNPDRLVDYIGNSSATVFDYDFKIYLQSHVKISIITIATGEADVLTDSEYSITGVGYADIGGTVTYPLVGAPLDNTKKIRIERVVPYTQTQAISNQAGYRPETVERSLDTIVMQIQQLAEGFDSRSLRIPAQETTIDPIPTSVERASKILGFDENGEPVVYTRNGEVGPGEIGTAELDNNAVTNAKMAQMMQATVSGRAFAAGTGDRQDLTAAQVRDIVGSLVVAQVANRTALKELNTAAVTLVYLNEGLRKGVFAWTSGDYAARITADTTEAYFIKANAIASNAGAWVRVSEFVSPQMCGAAADGVTNDYAASLAAFELAVRERLRWHLPKANYLWNLGGGSAVWDPTYLEAGGRRSIRMTGEGTRASCVEITNATSIGWQIASTIDWFDLHLAGFTVRGSFNFPLLVIGKNDYSDPVNMMYIQEVSVENSFDGSSNVACRLNYIAGGVTNNFRCASYALAVADVLTAVNGTALECRQVHFVVFNGGGFGNADRSVDFKDGTSVACVFNSPTLENANYCISNRSANSGAHTFNCPQLTNVLQYEAYSSAALANRWILIINPNADGVCEVDPSNYQQIKIIDDSTLGTPAAPTSTTVVTNTTGRDVFVTYWGLTTLTSITIGGLGDGIDAKSGGFFLGAGDTVALNYTGTLTWRWRNAC